METLQFWVWSMGNFKEQSSYTAEGHALEDMSNSWAIMIP